MVAKFVDHNNRQFFCNGDGEQQKAIGLDWQKNNFARASPFFVHFVTVVALLRHETSYFHAPDLWNRWTQHKNVLFFQTLDKVLSDLTQKISPTFDELNEIK